MTEIVRVHGWELLPPDPGAALEAWRSRPADNIACMANYVNARWPRPWTVAPAVYDQAPADGSEPSS